MASVSATFCWVFSLRQGALFFLGLSALASFFDMFSGIYSVGKNCPAAEILFLERGVEASDEGETRLHQFTDEENQTVRAALNSRNADKVTQLLCKTVPDDQEFTKVFASDPGEKATPVCQVKGTLKFCQGVVVFYMMAFAWVCTSAPLPSRKNIWFVIAYTVLMGIVEIWNVYGHVKSEMDEEWEPEQELPENCCYQFNNITGMCADHMWKSESGLRGTQFWVDAGQGFLHGWNVVILFSLIKVIEFGGTGDEMVANELLLDICHIDTPDRLVASSFCWWYTVKQGTVACAGLIFLSACFNCAVCVLRLTGHICKYGTGESEFYIDALSDDLEWKWPYCCFVIAETCLSFVINFLQFQWRSSLAGADKTIKDTIFKGLVLLETFLTMFMASAAFMISACYYPAFGGGNMGIDGCIYFIRILFLIYLWWLEWSLHYIHEAGGTGHEDWETVVDLIRAAAGIKLTPGSSLQDDESESDNLEELLGEGEVKATGSEDDFLDDLLGGALAGSGSEDGSGGASASKRRATTESSHSDRSGGTSSVASLEDVSGGSGDESKQSESQRDTKKGDRRTSSDVDIDDLLGGASVSSGDETKQSESMGSTKKEATSKVSVSEEGEPKKSE